MTFEEKHKTSNEVYETADHANEEAKPVFETFDEAYLALYVSTVKRCMNFSNRQQFYAEEIAHEAFVTLQKKWDSLLSHEVCVVRAFLYKTAKLKCKEFLEKNATDTVPFDDDVVQHQIFKRSQEAASIPDAMEEERKLRGFFEQIKKDLSKKEKLLFEYKVEQELPHEEIAKKLGITESASKMRWKRLKEKMSPMVKKLIAENS